MMHVARSKVGHRVAIAAQGACGCRYISNTRARSANRAPAEFTTAEHMLRPSPRAELEVMRFNKKNFRTSRFPEKYDIDFDFENTNVDVAGDNVPDLFENQFRYRPTIMRGGTESRADTGKKLVATAQEMFAKGTPLDLKWYNKAISDAGTAEQVEQLFHMAEKQGIVDNHLTSIYIYNVAKRKDGHQKAVEKFESVKKLGKVDDEILASGVTAYAKAMKGEKALEIYEQLQQKLGKDVPTRVNSSLMNYYFDYGQMTKGFEFFEKLEKSGAKINTKILTSLIRGYRMGGKLKDAQDTFDSIAKRGLVADNNAHCELVMAYARPGDNVHKMMGKLEEMKDAGHRPPYTLYNYIIRMMIIKEEYNNAMMALDMQFKEKSYPLEKRLVIAIARHFSKKEIGERVKPKTEYAIWIGRKAGLYTDDLFYLTTPHADFMDEYYFRHHPEWDFPDEARKSYQFKEFDERPVFHPEQQTNRFEKRAHERQLAARRAEAQEHGDLSWRAELPSFLEPFSVVTMRTPEFRWAPIGVAQDFVAQYDARVDAAWSAHLGAIETLELEAEHEQRDIAALEKEVAERKELVRQYKELKEKLRKEKEEWEQRVEEAKKVSAEKGEEVKAAEKETTEEKAKEEKVEAKVAEKETTEEKAKEKVEAEKEVKPTGENGTEAAKGEAAKEVGGEGKEAKVEKEKTPEETLESKKAELEETEKKEKENDGAIVLGEPKLIEMKEKAKGAQVAREAKLRDLYATRFTQYDDILPAHERIDRAQRRETVQQMRMDRVKEYLTGFERTPAHLITQKFDHKRLREIVVAVDAALANLKLEDREARNAYDRDRHFAHMQGWKATALRWLAKKYEVSDPLEFRPVPRKANDRGAPGEKFVTTQEARDAQAKARKRFQQLSPIYRGAAGDLGGLFEDEYATLTDGKEEVADDEEIAQEELLEEEEEDEEGRKRSRTFRAARDMLKKDDKQPKREGNSLFSDIASLLDRK